MSIVNATVACRKCGAPVTTDARDGVCPGCLFSQAGAAGSGSESSEPVVSGFRNPNVKAQSLEPVLHSFGDYELVAEIARGGMGRVFKARQKSLGRWVAVKFALAGQFAGKEVAQRFKSEAIAAAVLQHPNIVAVHEVGVRDGQHYFSMDYVEGRNLAESVGQRPLPAREAARYVKLIAEAIHYAHEKGILHRDLKPSNVLIDAATDQPRVTDFGLAKRLDGESSLTVSGQVLGSPHFMPPEQADPGRGKVGRASDVFGLGGILYFLLTARAPFQGETLEATIHHVLHTDPVSLRLLNPAVPRDLETLCLKCLEKQPVRRYQTADELVKELDRFLAHEPILARPISPIERVWRWCGRNPAVAAFAAATALLLLALAIGSPIAAWRIAAARNAERLQRERAEQNANELVKSLYVADMKTAWQALQEDNLLLARESVYRYLPALGMAGFSGEANGSPSQSAGDLRAGGLTRDLLGWEWRRLWQLCQSDETYTLHGDGLEVRSAVFSPDSRLVATARGQKVYVTDAGTRKQIAELDGFSDVVDNRAVAFSRNGEYLAAKGGTNVLIWQVGRWESPYRRLQGAPNWTHGNAVLFSPDDRRFLTRVEGGLGVWDTVTWRLNTVPGSRGFGIFLDYSADGEWLAVSEWEEMKILKSRSLEQIQVLHRPAGVGYFDIIALDFCPQHGLLAAGYRDGEVRLWEVGSWREIGSFQAHVSFAFGLAFSPDGNLLATGGSDQAIKFWDVFSLTNKLSAGPPREPAIRPRGHPATDLMSRAPLEGAPQPIKVFKGHHAGIHDLRFAPDGRSIVTASKDGTAKLWDPFRAVESDTLPNSEQLAWFSPDGARLITLNGDGRLHHWNTRDREESGIVGPDLHDPRVKAWTISDHGEKLAVGRDTGGIEIWNLKTGQLDKSFQHASVSIGRLAFSRDATLLAAAGERIAGEADGARLRIWDIASGAIVGTYTNAFGPLTFSPDGQSLVSTRLEGGVVVWDLDSGRSAAEIDENFTWIGALALSPDGRLLVTGSEEPVVHVCDMTTGRRVDSLKGSRMCIDGLAFTSDAKTVVTRTVDNAMKFWNVATGKEIFTLGPHKPVHSFLFSPNGEYLAITMNRSASEVTTLAAASQNRAERRVELWRAPSFEEIIAAEEAKLRKE